MHDPGTPKSTRIDIRTPCPKGWDDLVGDERRRFCAACSLTVHDAAQLTRGEAEALVQGSLTRVCMRMQYGPDGAPIFRDSAPAQAARPMQPLVRWALTAAASVLAACTEPAQDPAATNAPAATQPGDPAPSTSCPPRPTELLGDVAISDPPLRVLLGEVSAPSDPQRPQDPAPSGTDGPR